MTLVQPIAVSKTGTHEETVIAVGLASVMCWKHSYGLSCWEEWFEGPFTKTVRRGTTKQVEDCQIFPGAYTYRVGTTTAVAVPPMDDEPSLPKPLNRMQVSGLDLVRHGWFSKPQDKQVAFVINNSLKMTTGKTAAQLAHAMVGYSRLFGFDWMTNYCVHDDPSLFAYCEGSSESVVRINDAGRTEVKPHSLTVIVTQL